MKGVDPKFRRNQRYAAQVGHSTRPANLTKANGRYRELTGN
jgi:hypothetical protein